MNWEIQVEKVSNGYVCRWWEEEEGGDELVKETVVFEKSDIEQGELEAFVAMSHFLSDHFGVGGSKHDRYRIRCDVVEQKGAEDADGLRA